MIMFYLTIVQKLNLTVLKSCIINSFQYEQTKFSSRLMKSQQNRRYEAKSKNSDLEQMIQLFQSKSVLLQLTVLFVFQRAGEAYFLSHSLKLKISRVFNFITQKISKSFLKSFASLQSKEQKVKQHGNIQRALKMISF